MNQDASSLSPYQTSGVSCLRCVWMMAGLVTFKLCDRAYNCEDCPFDIGIRDRRKQPASHANVASLGSSDATPPDKAVGELSFSLDTSLFYHPGHLWARVEENGRIRFGIDDLAQGLFGRVYAVDLPDIGQAVRAESPCWKVSHSSGDTELAAPMTGRISERNEALRNAPSKLNSDPYGGGWAMVMESDNLPDGLRSLLYGSRAVAWHHGQLERLRTDLVGLSSGDRLETGRTQQDGGVPVFDWARLLTRCQRLQLIEQFVGLKAYCNQRKT
ncbi:MAG: glycine cleavage system protein H [Acidobacteriota bacterium]